MYGRKTAKFHVQVEIVSLEKPGYFPATIQLEGRLIKIFRDNENQLTIGDTITFPIEVTDEGAFIPEGATLWTYYKNISSARFMEAFLNGEPPDLEIELWQKVIIPSASEKPYMIVKDDYAEW